MLIFNFIILCMNYYNIEHYLFYLVAYKNIAVQFYFIIIYKYQFNSNVTL